MRRVHRMPFGARIDGQGALFRLWAPAAKQVMLHLPELRRDMPLTPVVDGWHEARIDATAGHVYQYKIGDQLIPDPGSRFQPGDVHGPSELIDPEAFDWPDEAWIGRPWHEAVVYELHVGTFTREGTFAAAEAELGRLADLGITAIELMPLSEFAGKRNWGYDGVLPFAPERTYGRPADLKSLIAAAHGRGMMVLLDVVYNHFGPEGNYLRLYAPQFFAQAKTDWGDAIDFGQRNVRDYFIENALYWLVEYNFDGLRFDAVHAIQDEGGTHFLAELAARIRLAMPPGRHIHLVLENDRNEARYLAPGCYNAQWNDDFHHAAHVILTGETFGYYADYADKPVEKLGRALAEGFIYQGEVSPYRGALRGEKSAELPPLAFVNFLQNHDQIGNRALGERLSTLARPEALDAMTAVLLLAPSPPMLFMGEEWGATSPFLFFCDFHGDLATAVRDGRRREFAKFPAFSSPEAAAKIPDPQAADTFLRSQLVHPASREQPPTETLVRMLLAIRRREIVPRLTGMKGGATHDAKGACLSVYWQLADGSFLHLAANLGTAPLAWPRDSESGRVLWGPEKTEGAFAPWTVRWTLAEAKP